MSLFNLPPQIPAHVPAIQAFRATTFKTLAHRDEPFQRALAARIERSTKLFGLPKEGSHENGRTVFRDAASRLHVYYGSDSLWWAHDKLTNFETQADAAGLPGEKDAPLHAAREFDRLSLDAAAATLASVNYAEFAVQKGNEKPQSFRTAVHANYRFELDKLPVFGPGAKIKVTFAGGAQLAQVIYFWRKPSSGESMKTISPEEALNQFQRDPAFFRLNESEAVIDIHSIRLGYFALPPAEFQRYYIPVYAIDATTKTRELPRYDFRRYVCAVPLSNDQVKRMDVVANPTACRMF